MSNGTGPPEIGQWYLHRDKGEMFRVTGIDEPAGTIEIQNFDGDLDEIEAGTWGSMRIERAAEPEDWTGPVDDVETDDLGYSDTAMKESDWTEPLQEQAAGQEAWEDSTPEDERDPEGEGSTEEPLAADEPAASKRLR